MKNNKKKSRAFTRDFKTWQYLDFRAASSQVLSALRTLLLYSEWEQVFPRNYCHQIIFIIFCDLARTLARASCMNCIQLATKEICILNSVDKTFDLLVLVS